MTRSSGPISPSTTRSRRPRAAALTGRYSTTSSLPTTSRYWPAWSVPRARSGTSSASFSAGGNADPDEEARQDHASGFGKIPRIRTVPVPGSTAGS